MKKILLGAMLLSTLFFGAEIKKDTVAFDNLVVKFYGLSIKRTYKCEPKESKWFGFNTKKDYEIEKYCKNSLDNYASVDSGLFYNNHGYDRYIEKSFNNISSLNKFNINEIFKDVEIAKPIASKVDLGVYYLDKINEKKSAQYEIYLITPNNEKNFISKGNINEKEFALDIPKTLVLNKYTNTYNIDNLRECIDGKVWIKKYGKMSGDECFWKIENKSQQNYWVNSDSKEFELFKQFLEFQDYKNGEKGNKMQLITIDEEVYTGIGKDNQGIELSIQLNSFGFSGRWKYDKEEEIEIYHLKEQSFEISNEHFISLCELTKKIAIDIEISSGNIFIN